MENKKPTKPNGLLINTNPKSSEWVEMEVYWDLVDNSVWLFRDPDDLRKSISEMDLWKSRGYKFKPLPSEAVKEVKPQSNTPFGWPDYWGYVAGDINVPVGLMSSKDPFEEWLEEDMRPDLSNNVKHPSHYNQDGEIECIDAIKASLGFGGFAAYCRGNTMKYLWRYTYKNGLEDLHKAQQYLEWLIETEEEIKSCSSQQ